MFKTFVQHLDLYLPSVVAAVAVALACAPLSVLVVLKRLAFIGQGVSHSAFGGVGLALAIGLGVSAGGPLSAAGRLAVLGLVLAFGAGSAFVIARLSRRGRTEADAAIGIVLSACMALGFLLHRVAAERAAEAGAPAPPSLESILFGSILGVDWWDAGVACAAAGLINLAAWWWRRPLLFWGFDEQACAAFGVSAERSRALLYVLLSAATVVTMQVAGVLLATALLILPGAVALAMSGRLAWVTAWSFVAAVAGVGLGLAGAFVWDLQPGPAVVGAMVAIFAAARLRPRGVGGAGLGGAGAGVVGEAGASGAG